MLSTKFPSTSDVKQFQAYLIFAARFEVTEMPDMPRSRIVSEMHSAYLRQGIRGRVMNVLPSCATYLLTLKSSRDRRILRISPMTM